MTSMTCIDASSGRIHSSLRSLVNQADVDAMSDALDAAFLGGRPVLPFGDGLWSMHASFNDRGMIATAWRGPKGSAIPILTLAVAPEKRISRFTWTAFHLSGDDPMATSETEPPEAPWIATRPEIGAERDPEAMPWAIHIAKIAAWAWIDYDGKAARRA